MRWFYLRDEKGFPVACIVSEKIATGIHFAVSTYNPSDPFNKNVARAVAEGRLSKGIGHQGTSFISGEEDIKKRVMKTILDLGEIEGSKYFPTRTREAARLWLKNNEKRKSKEAA